MEKKVVGIILPDFNKVLKDNKLAIFTVKLGARKYFETLMQIIRPVILHLYLTQGKSLI